MSNNRMLLVHRATGRALVLGGWYPSTGWGASQGLTARLNKFFDEFETIDWENGADFDLAYESEDGLVYVSHEPLIVTREPQAMKEPPPTVTVGGKWPDEPGEPFEILVASTEK